MKSDGLGETGLWLFQPTSGKQLCFLHLRDLVYNLFPKKPQKDKGRNESIWYCMALRDGGLISGHHRRVLSALIIIGSRFLHKLRSVGWVWLWIPHQPQKAPH